MREYWTLRSIAPTAIPTPAPRKMQTSLQWKGPTSTNTQHSTETDTEPHHRTSLWMRVLGTKQRSNKVPMRRSRQKKIQIGLGLLNNNRGQGEKNHAFKGLKKNTSNLEFYTLPNYINQMWGQGKKRHFDMERLKKLPLMYSCIEYY